MPIEDVVLNRLSSLYPADKPKLWEQNMKAAITEYRRLLLEQCPGDEFEEMLQSCETLIILKS